MLYRDKAVRFPHTRIIVVFSKMHYLPVSSCFRPLSKRAKIVGLGHLHENAVIFATQVRKREASKYCLLYQWSVL